MFKKEAPVRKPDQVNEPFPVPIKPAHGLNFNVIRFNVTV